VGVKVSEMAKNPIFDHRKPVFKFDWIWFDDLEMGKPEVANELRAFVTHVDE
jgi:alanine-alpha-ketoisovalerate/valine-pyruvate aminotransferase